MLAEAVQPAEQLKALWSNPLLLSFLTLLVAWLASRVVLGQVRQMGLEQASPDGRKPFAWSIFFSALVFWLVLDLGLNGIASSLELSVVGRFLEATFDILLRAGLAGAILAAAGVFADVLNQPAAGADPADLAKADRERRMILLVGGVLAVGAVTGLSLGTWIFLALITIPAVLLFKNASYRSKVSDVLTDFASGLRLRDQFQDGNQVHDGVRLAGKVGLTRTWVHQDGRKQLLRNEALMALVTGAPAPAEQTSEETSESS